MSDLSYDELVAETKMLFSRFKYAIVRDNAFLVLGFVDRADAVATRLLCLLKLFDSDDNMILLESVIGLLHQESADNVKLDSEIALSFPEDVLERMHSVLICRVIENNISKKKYTLSSSQLFIDKQ